MSVVAILYSSFAQSPRSINLQRSLQNGRNLFSVENSESARQFGQGTKRFFVEGIQALSKKDGEREIPRALKVT